MNILFLTLVDFKSIAEHNIYTDLLREFMKHGDDVFVISPSERRTALQAMDIEEKHCRILKPRIGNIQKTSTIEKGISTVTLNSIVKRAIKKHWHDVDFDLVIYSTPPITFTNTIAWIKKRNNAKTYLLLKDIFPQNAVDLGMMSTSGVKSIFYQYFRYQEKQLYSISDRIGCMSPANVEYVLKHNPEVEASKVEVCPNSIEVQDVSVTEEERAELRKKYGIPLDKNVFVYGGNLGKPQGVPFIIDCLRACQDMDDAFFFIVGSGTDYGLLEEFVKAENPENVRLLSSLPKDEYDHMLAACDVGLIFLDHCFTIPNFPSRLLSYMQAGLPVLACTDTATDIGQVIVDGGFGWWCEGNDLVAFKDICKVVTHNSSINILGVKAKEYLHYHYNTTLISKILLHNKAVE